MIENMDERYEYMSIITKDMVKFKLPERPPEAHKGVFGKLFCLCGSRSMPGAAWLSITSAFRCGVGTVRACVVPSIYNDVFKNIPEATFCVLEEDKDGFVSKNSIDKILESMNGCTAGLIGCGLGWTEDVKFIVSEIIKKSKIPLVIDADGINVISENIDILREAECEIILTPHVKEMSRLIKVDSETIEISKMKYASEFAKEYEVTTLIKGSKTAIGSTKGEIFVNTLGNVGMAKGGSGDVLSGMIASFLSQKLSPLDATICGTFIHSFAGDRCADKKSNVSMIPSDIINELPETFLEFKT